MVATGKRLPRRRRSETRELLLAAGTLLVDDLTRGGRDDLLQRMFAHLKLDEVLEAATRLQVFLAENPPPMPATHAPTERDDSSPTFAGWIAERRQEILSYPLEGYGRVPKASVYTVFDSEADFHAELARRLYSGRSNESTAMEDAASELLGNSGELPPLPVLIRTLAEAEFRRTMGLAAHVDLGATPYLGDDELAGIMHDGYMHEMAILCGFYGQMLEPYGRRLRQDVTIEDLFAALDAMFFGFAFRGRVAPELMGPDSDRGAKLFADVAEAIVLAFTEEA
jgi:hypothetical protein